MDNMESKTGKQRREVIDARNTIIDATNQFSDFCNMRLDSLQYRGIVQGIDISHLWNLLKHLTGMRLKHI